jgi:hypothetical protein
MSKNRWSHVAGNKQSIADFIIANVYFTMCDEKLGQKLGCSKSEFEEFPNL